MVFFGSNLSGFNRKFKWWKYTRTCEITQKLTIPQFQNYPVFFVLWFNRTRWSKKTPTYTPWKPTTPRDGKRPPGSSQVFRFGGDIYQSLMELMELVFRRRKMVPLAGEQWDVKVEFRIETTTKKTTKGSQNTSPKSREKSQDAILESIL